MDGSPEYRTKLAGLRALADAPTCDLQWELERREGVHSYRLAPEARVEIVVDGVRRYAGPGPMTVTVNRD